MTAEVEKRKEVLAAASRRSAGCISIRLYAEFANSQVHNVQGEWKKDTCQVKHRGFCYLAKI